MGIFVAPQAESATQNPTFIVKESKTFVADFILELAQYALFVQ